MSRSAQRAGWKLLPVPFFWPAHQFWNNGNGRRNAACIDFSHPRDYANCLADSGRKSPVCSKPAQAATRIVPLSFRNASTYCSAQAASPDFKSIGRVKWLRIAVQLFR